MFRKAQRSKQKLRLALIGPSGSGKTMGALKVAFGLGKRTVLIDTENGSGDLYDYLGDYDVYTFSPPFDPDKLVHVMQAAEQEGYDTIVIDSLSHFWMGEGGMLDIVNGLGGRFSDWNKANPKQKHLLEAILRSQSHVIATMRSKTEYIITEEEQKNGFKKQKVEKAGTAAVQRDNLEYEFTVVLNLNMQHLAEASKDRTGLFDGNYTKLSDDTGRQLIEWLEKGTERMVTEFQRKRMSQLAKELGMTAENMKEIMREQFGVDKSQDLTEKQGNSLIGYLETMKSSSEIAATTTEGEDEHE
jgi:hypothetical protein